MQRPRRARNAPPRTRHERVAQPAHARLRRQRPGRPRARAPEGVRSQYALTALDLSNNRLGDSGAEIVANELRANHALQFVRCAGNAIGPTGGRSLGEALSVSANDALLFDAKYNPAIEYRDLVAIRLSNCRREPDAGASPLDGWGKQEE